MTAVLAFGGAALDAELVALGVGQDDPAGAVGAAVVGDQGGADPEQPLDLLVAGPVVGHQVQVDPVLDRLGLGHGDEQQPGLAVRPGQEPLGVARLVGVVGVLLVAGDLAPELDQGIRVGAVEGDVAGTGGHGGSLTVGGAAVRTGRPAAARVALTSAIESWPKWKTLAARTASAPARQASAKWSTWPAPPLAMTGRSTAEVTARTRSRS